MLDWETDNDITRRRAAQKQPVDDAQ